MGVMYMITGLAIVGLLLLAMTLRFAYALGTSHGRQRARRTIEQGLLNGKVTLYGKTYWVQAVEFTEAVRHG
jgi:hypothetical protein